MAYLEPLFTGDVNDLENGGGAKKIVIAPGTYKAVIVTEQVKPNKNNNGMLLVIGLEIVEGEYKGTAFTDYINITNQNDLAQRLGQERKARIGQVLFSNPNFTDSAMLRNKIINIEVVTEPNEFTNDKGEVIKGVQNKIKWYHPVGAASKAPAIAHSTITNGAGGSMSTAEMNRQLDNEIPF